jgi:Glycosyltransferase family 87
MPPFHPGTRTLSPTVALCLALIGAASFLYYHQVLFMPRVIAVRTTFGLGHGYSFGGDFYPVWLTTREWQLHRLDLYSPQMTGQIQIGLYGRTIDPSIPGDPPADYRRFAYPAFTDLIFWPTTLLDFPRLRIVLGILLPLLVVLTLRLWLLAIDWRVSRLSFTIMAVLTVCSYQALEGLFAEQPGLFVGFFLSGAALAIRRNRLILAGVLMSLTLIKPQVTILALLYLLLWSFADRRRARFWIAFATATLCLCAASLLLWPHWIHDWIGVLLGYSRYAGPSLLNVLLGSSLGRFLGPVLTTLALLVSVAYAWKMRRTSTESPAFWHTLATLLAVTCAILLPGLAVYDQLILLPGILLLFRAADQFRLAGFISRGLLGAGALVLVWPWISAFALLILLSLAPAFCHSRPVFMTPIRGAVPLPFVVLCLLLWMKRINASGIAAAS